MCMDELLIQVSEVSTSWYSTTYTAIVRMYGSVWSVI